MKLRDLLIVASAKVRDKVVAGTNIIACNLELLTMIWTLWQIL